MSVSKAISAIVLFLLVERELIDPQAPVARYWPSSPPGQIDLSLGHVLDHRAGLPWISETLRAVRPTMRAPWRRRWPSGSAVPARRRPGISRAHARLIIARSCGA